MLSVTDIKKKWYKLLRRGHFLLNSLHTFNVSVKIKLCLQFRCILVGTIIKSLTQQKDCRLYFCSLTVQIRDLVVERTVVWFYKFLWIIKKVSLIGINLVNKSKMILVHTSRRFFRNYLTNKQIWAQIKVNYMLWRGLYIEVQIKIKETI